MILGGWDLDDVKGCNLPQKAQTAFTAVTSEIVGCTMSRLRSAPQASRISEARR